ncbi:Uncharacterised protein [Vibrio cholerae]|uniref:Uncharacterized protein n=1 Tax=Vibrio cholerae TaxID=666 RepID=A0A655YT25_VIBCL|nr:Uncharacterised protein [Vibrio cholerae]CSC47650.1 Uncharacterised protein [Vibrio cholerae]
MPLSSSESPLGCVAALHDTSARFLFPALPLAQPCSPAPCPRLLGHCRSGIGTKFRALSSGRQYAPCKKLPSRHRMSRLSGPFDQIVHFLLRWSGHTSCAVHDRRPPPNQPQPQSLALDKYGSGVGNRARSGGEYRNHRGNRRSHHEFSDRHRSRRHLHLNRSG